MKNNIRPYELFLLLNTMILVCGFVQLSAQLKFEPVKKEYFSNLPFNMAEIQLPKISERTFNIIEYGAIGDGLTMNSTAFSKAIKACFDNGGGRIIVPPGLWLTGPIELMSNIDLHLEKGSLIVFSPEHLDFPLLADKNSKKFTCMPLIYGYGLENIAITGEGLFNGNGHTWRPVKKSKLTASQWKELVSSGGVVNEKGDVWWPSESAMNAEKYISDRNRSELLKSDYENVRDFLRPFMLYLEKCKNILIEGISLQNSPKFAMNLVNGENIIVRRVKVMNEEWAQNGDGLDLSACKNVLMYDCTVNAGDDGIGMKSSGKPENAPALENIVIADCVVYHGHGGFVVGSNTNGGIKNISVKNCNFIDTDIGLRFKSGIGRGNVVEDIYIDGIYMKDIKGEAILFDMLYVDVSAVKAKDEKIESNYIPQFRKIFMKNVFCDGAEKAFRVRGLDIMPVKEIHLANAVIKAKEGFESIYAENFEFNNVKIIPKKSPVFSFKETGNFLLDNVLYPEKTTIFLKVEGSNTRGIILQNIDLSKSKIPFEFSDNAKKEAIIIK